MCPSGLRLFPLEQTLIGKCSDSSRGIFFPRYECPRAIINDGGSHFTNAHFHVLLKKYEVHHRVTTPYNPQANQQVEVSDITI